MDEQFAQGAVNSGSSA